MIFRPFLRQYFGKKTCKYLKVFKGGMFFYFILVVSMNKRNVRTTYICIE